MLAARRGTLLHRLIERLPEVAGAGRESAGRTWLARVAPEFSERDHEEMVRSALAVLDHPDWADVFGPDSLAEVPLAAVVGGRVVSGTVDRLVIGEDRIRIVDFKTALLYTHTPQLFVVPQEVIAAHKLRLGGEQESFSL